MTDQNLFGYEGGGQTEIAPGSSNTKGAYKFTPEELQVLQQCNNESFFKRSLPLGTLLGLGTFMGVQKGHFKASPRFGAFPKVTLAVIVGYFLGKISYQRACAEKLMALPGSYIGQLLRDKKSPSRSYQSSASMFGASSGDIYSDAGPGSSLNLDTDRPLFNEDSYHPPDSDIGSAPGSPENSPSKTLSYEELRRKNRGDYNESRQEPYKIQPNTAPIVTRAQPSPQSPTNKYGDTME
ncbi:OCIA domain-containing protein 1-like [Leptidea sinapis]|uniref:OCIA domain-containing protein 1-like n=1 Tax=Leptidea sinapis TaxID=189913 RepID=UPI00213E9D2D|nr:OCIA domain-containing protein 1-like [Leptidea sinapis]